MAEKAASVAGLPVDNALGARWMIASSIAFAISTSVIKYVARELPAAEIAFFRCFFGLSVIAPFIMRYGLAVYRTTRVDLHLFRVACAVGGLILGFYSVAHLPLATAMSLGYTRPLFMILIGVMVLHEQVRWRRGLATFAGFVGVLVVLGPVHIDALPPALAQLAAAACTAAALAVVRHQAATDGPVTILVWFATGTVLGTAVPAAIVWQTPETPQTWALLVFIGICSTTGQFFLIKALAHGEATVMNPIDYSQILITGVIGYLFFGEVPSATTWIGAAIIVASTLYILVRESRLRRAVSHGDTAAIGE